MLSAKVEHSKDGVEMMTSQVKAFYGYREYLYSIKAEITTPFEALKSAKLSIDTDFFSRCPVL
jgi:hypothetical protein